MKTRLYVDGLLEGSLAHFGWLSGSNNSLDIGRRATTNDRYFSGNIGGVRIYDHALTGEEIAQVHSIPEPASLSILLWLLAGFGALAHARRPRRSRG